MKKMMMTIAFALVTLGAFAQKEQPIGLRMEVAEAETDHAEYSIFTYRDEDDNFGYYLSLAKVTHILGLLRDDITDAAFDAIKETCICLGATYDEANATLDTILDLFDKDVDTRTELKSRAVTGSDRLGHFTTSTCIVQKKALGGKRLQFVFTQGKHQAEAFVTKTIIKELRTSLKIDKKLHPKQHRVGMAAAAASAAGGMKVSILGDSYSTFQGVIPANYSSFYPNDRNDCTEVNQTWWDLYIKAKGYVLEKNDSWGGTTICGTGYGGMDFSRNNFISRVDSLGNPDIIFVFGGTNDAWANAPMGEYQYAEWTKEDCRNFRPALACLLDMLQKRYPKAKLCSILNSELREPVNESMREVCKHYNVQLIELHDIEKQNGHPSIKGMKSICDQLLEAGL